MMGDFNATPSEPGLGMGLWYDLHVESDACTTNSACRHTYKIVPNDLDQQDEKIDYIFGHDFYCNRQGVAPSVRRYGNLSDHAFVRGYIVCPN